MTFVPGVVFNLTLAGGNDDQAVYSLPMTFGHDLADGLARKRAPTTPTTAQTVNMLIDLGSSDMVSSGWPCEREPVVVGALGVGTRCRATEPSRRPPASRQPPGCACVLEHTRAAPARATSRPLPSACVLGAASGEAMGISRERASRELTATVDRVDELHILRLQGRARTLQRHTLARQ